MYVFPRFLCGNDENKRDTYKNITLNGKIAIGVIISQRLWHFWRSKTRIYAVKLWNNIEIIACWYWVNVKFCYKWCDISFQKTGELRWTPWIRLTQHRIKADIQSNISLQWLQLSIELVKHQLDDWIDSVVIKIHVYARKAE